MATSRKKIRQLEEELASVIETALHMYIQDGGKYLRSSKMHGVTVCPPGTEVSMRIEHHAFAIVEIPLDLDD